MGSYSAFVEEEGYREGYPVGYQEGYRIGIEPGIHGVISAAREFQISEADILESIKKWFSLTDEEARKYMSEFK